MIIPEHPVLPSTEFSRRILQLNGMDGEEFRRWELKEGMEFDSSIVWWGRGGRRSFPHEGVDLCAFLTAEGERRILPDRTLVPVLYPGVVRAVTADFVASSVWMRHEKFRAGLWTIHSVYAHVTPAEGVKPGHEMTEGKVVGRVAASSRPSGPPPHLHLSLAFVHDDVRDEAFDWACIHGEPGIHLLDPGILPGLSEVISISTNWMGGAQRNP